MSLLIKTGEYEVSEGPIRSTDATQCLLERCPEAKGRIWKRRVGSPAAHRIGGRFLPAGEVTCEELSEKRKGRTKRTPDLRAVQSMSISQTIRLCWFEQTLRTFSGPEAIH